MDFCPVQDGQLLLHALNYSNLIIQVRVLIAYQHVQRAIADNRPIKGWIAKQRAVLLDVIKTLYIHTVNGVLVTFIVGVTYVSINIIYLSLLNIRQIYSVMLNLVLNNTFFFLELRETIWSSARLIVVIGRRALQRRLRV